MTDKQYMINRGVNKAVEFKGFQAQYIGLVAAAAIGSLGLFGLLYATGVNTYVCVPAAMGTGAVLIRRVKWMSYRYGQYGMMKWTARRRVPKALRSRSREIFIKLKANNGNAIG